VAEVTAAVGAVSLSRPALPLLRLLLMSRPALLLPRLVAPSSRPALLLSRLVALSSRQITTLSRRAVIPSYLSQRYPAVGQVLSQLST
jgi:hypothetical protein